MTDAQRVAAVLNAVRGLPRREREIIVRRFGLTPTGSTYTIEELASLYDVSPERMRNNEAIALAKIASVSGVRR